MQNDHIDRHDLYRMADDGCPNGPSGDSQSYDLAEFWAKLSNIDKPDE